MGSLPIGDFRAVWDGRDETGATVAAGAYFLRLETEGAIETAKVLRLD